MENGAGGFTSDWKYPRWLMWALVIFVSFDALARAFSNWHAYDAITRADVIAFLVLLVAFPVRLALGFKKKPLAVEQTVVFTYLLLLMSTILSRH